MRIVNFLVFLLFSCFIMSQNSFLIENNELKLSAESNEFYEKSLPSAFDLTGSQHWPPIYRQTNWVCNQVAASYYMMSFETNNLKNISSQNPLNCFSIYFPWNIGNGGFGWFGDHYIITMEMMKQFGMPKFNEFPYDNPPDSSKWMNGYSLYYSAMHNKIEDYYTIKVNSLSGITALKTWVYNHGGQHYGGTATFMANIADNGASLFPSGTPYAGAYVIGKCGNDALHARTIVGYDDNVCYDYNNDGQYTKTIDLNGDGIIDVRDWEKGGFRLAESNGPTWQGDGYMWIMYKAMADEYGAGGILNNSTHVIVPKIDYDPMLTVKFEIKYASRERIKISVGVASDTTANTWDYLIDFPLFNYLGGNKYMQGGETEADKTLQAGLDITSLLGKFNENACARLFFVVDEADENNIFDGYLNLCSFIDYSSSSPISFDAVSSQVPLTSNGRTVFSAVVCAEHLKKPEIYTLSIPVLAAQSANWYELDYLAGTGENKWELLPYYETSITSVPFDLFSGTKLTPDSNFDGAVSLDLPFQFPFGNITTNKIKIHTNGYILPHPASSVWTQFRENLYPFFINDKVIAPLARFSMINNHSYGDGIWYKISGDTVKIRWSCSDQYSEPWTMADFGCNLISDGKIEFTYGDVSLNKKFSNIGGISFGNQSDNLIYWKDNEIPTKNTKLSIEPYPVPSSLYITNSGVLYGTPGEYYDYPFNVKLTDFNRVSDTKTYFLTTQIDENILPESSVEIYPNPAKENVIVRLNDPSLQIDKITLFDVSGKQMASFNSSFSNEFLIDLSFLKSGIYNLSIHTKSRIINKRIIKI